jgi:L-amino acid N-acyltransferase YncA
VGDLAIRPATTDDAPTLLTIYRPIVEETAISFELDCPTAEAFAERLGKALDTHAWLVAETDGAIAGYAYGSAHRPWAAYDHSVEVSAYVSEAFRGRGIGKRLYGYLFEALVKKGYFNAFAGITLPNAGSVALHESVGFAAIGTFPRVGFKLG